MKSPANRLIAAAALLGIAASSTLAIQGMALITGCSWKPNKGLFLVNAETGVKTTISTDGSDWCTYSPDGMRVLYKSGGNLYIINNDGTNKQLFLSPGISPSCCNATTGLKWVQAGIFWQEDGGGIWRMDPVTKQKTQIATVTGDYYQGLWASSDGRRIYVWTRNNETEHLYPLVDFSANWASYTVRWVGTWGHGYHLVLDGSALIIDDWRGVCNTAGTPCTDYGSHQTFIQYNWDSAASDMTRGIVKSWAANAAGNQVGTHDVHPAINSNDHFCFEAGGSRYTSEDGTQFPPQGTQCQRMWVMNWRTQVVEEIPHPDLCNWVCLSGFWLGQLPNPNPTAPQIALDKSTLNFASGGAAQTVTVTNSGAGTLTKVSTAVAPSASWLTVTVNGSGGNTQTISNAVNAGSLSDGSYSATVTVSGGGATNTAQYTVILTVGTGIAPPTGLSATVGGATARNVSLSWTDNASNETGYSVERNLAGGAWSVIATLGANAAAYADTGLAVGTYNYRVRAVRNTSYSAYSNTAQAVVAGLASVTLSSPVSGQVVTDSVLHIRWSANQVTNVEIKYSLNQGNTWVSLNQTGGLTSTSPSWGDFVWQVPSISADSVLVWVHQYQNTGVGAVSDYFSIRRATIVTRGRPGLAGASWGLLGCRRSPSGRLAVDYALPALQAGDGQLEVYAINGSRLVSRRLAPAPGIGHVVLDLPAGQAACVVRLVCGGAAGSAIVLSAR